MGGVDKAMVMLAGRPLLAHVVARLAPQVAAMAISANGDPARFAGFGLPVLADAADGPAGPLAGLLAGARWALTAHPRAWLLSAPCDVPFLPADLVARLGAARLPACAAAAGRLHPLVALWRPRELAAAAGEGGSARALLARLGGASVAWQAAEGAADPFANINDPAALSAASGSITAG